MEEQSVTDLTKELHSILENGSDDLNRFQMEIDMRLEGCRTYKERMEVITDMMAENIRKLHGAYEKLEVALKDALPRDN